MAIPSPRQTPMPLPDYIHETVDALHTRGVEGPLKAAVILGTGLGSFTDAITPITTVAYNDIPHFPASSVKGHAGQLIYGTVDDQKIIAFSGRFHYYEGYSMEQTTLPVILTKALGAEKLIISNAAGGINTNFETGDLMIIRSIIRQNKQLTFANRQTYRYNHSTTARQAYQLITKLGLPIQQGTYIYACGPNYETKAEIRAFRRMGADAVGMSTAPELAAAAQLNLKTAAVSLISNMAAGVHKGQLNHEEVKAAADARKADFTRLVKELVTNL